MPSITTSYKNEISFQEEVHVEQSDGPIQVAIDALTTDMAENVDSMMGYFEVIANSPEELEKKTQEAILFVEENAKNIILTSEETLGFDSENLNRFAPINSSDIVELIPENALEFTCYDGEKMVLFFNTKENITKDCDEKYTVIDALEEYPLNEEVNSLNLDYDVEAYGYAVVLSFDKANQYFKL